MTAEWPERFRELQLKTLELAIEDRPLHAALDDLIRLVEASSSAKMLGSILLVSDDKAHLVHGAAPSLPRAYNEAIDGIEIGDGIGSCGTAAYSAKPVYVSDIDSDPLWVNFRDLAVSHGLRACWSTPILSPEGEVLGTFAMYYGEPRKPAAADLDTVSVITRSAGLMISRKRAETRLKASEERLRLAVDNAEIGFWDVDVINDVLIWPARTKAMFGISPTVAVSMVDFYDGLHPEDRDVTSAAYAAATDPGKQVLYDVEYRTVGKEDGVIRWVAAKGRGVFDETGRCLRVIGTAIEITDRKRTEAALRELNEHLELQVADRTAAVRLFQDIVASATAPICAFDQEFRLIAFNAAHSNDFFRIYGYRVKVGDVFPDLFEPEQGRTIKGFMARALAGEAFTVTEEFGDPDLVKPYWEIAYSPLRDEAGDVFGAFHYALDISDRLRAQAELEEAREALRQSQKMEAVGQLTGGIAHDFNNMLAVVIGSLDLLNRRIGGGDSRAKRYIDAAADGAKRAALLTQRLLAFSRQQPLKPEPVNVNRLVVGMSDLLHHSLGGEIRLETVLAGGAWRISADPNQLENVILNLAINARDAMSGGGRLTIETQNTHLDERYVAPHLGVPAGQYVLIAVTDTGAGMPEDVMAKAFDPFFTTKEVGKGTGLGLSQVYGFVKQSGGHVKIYSESGQGTTVKVYLPRLLGDVVETPDSEATGNIALGESLEVVLVVEDEPAVRQFSVDALAELGYSVLEADGAAAALSLLKTRQDIALLFTDVVMPEVNGAKLAEEARSLRPTLPILFTTGYTRNAVVHNGVLDAGVQLIGKPFSVEALAAKVREVLDDAAAAKVKI